MPETGVSAAFDRSPRTCEVCGKECVGAGGLGAHMSVHYRKGEAEPSIIGSRAKVSCPHCHQWVSKSYLSAHIDRKHMGAVVAKGILADQAKFASSRPLPMRVQTENLSAREVCRVVLEQALHDGKINLDALDAYEQWVQDTEKFLGVLYR